jgi:predicted GIY-YIG superfamily endonuclease
MGAVYMLHFAAPLSGKHAYHYVGYAAKDTERRIDQHRMGQAGAVFTTEARRQGIPFQVAAIWQDCTPIDERSIKRQRNHKRRCPVCRPDGIQPMLPTSRSANQKEDVAGGGDFGDYPF